MADDPTCFNVQCGNMSLEELFHQQMAHVPILKLAKMSYLIDCLPHHLHFPKALRVPCALCNEAKAKSQPFPDASDKHSRYAITILHKNSADFVRVLCKAIAKARFTLKHIQCDKAEEYLSRKLTEFLDANNIIPEFSNPFEQHCNGLSETYIDSIGKGIHTLLLQSHLPPEFWSAAAHCWTNVYNHVPHSSINYQIPFTVHHGSTPDVSWFRSFGCSCTVFRGRDLVNHHKLAPHGELGVFVCLGMSHEHKCWLVYCPLLNRIFAYRNVTFNDTLYQLKESDQHVYGYYDSAAITQMRADAYCFRIHDTSLDDILQMPLSIEPVTTNVDCNFDVLDDQDLSSSCVSAFEDDNVHPAVLQARRNTSHLVENADGSNTEAHWGNGSLVGLCWGSDLSHDCVHGNVMEDCWGNSHGERFSEAPPPLGQLILHWLDCKSKPIASVTDSELGEYLIGHSFVIQFPAYYWPNEKIKGKYNMCKGQPFKKQEKTQIAYLPISKAGPGPDVSIRNTLILSKPKATMCVDLTCGSNGPKYIIPQPSQLVTCARSASGSNKNLTRKVTTNAELLASAAVLAMLSSHQSKHAYVSAFHEPNPKNQRETRASQHVEEWKLAEEIEIKTLWGMGTWKIVDTPCGCTPLPCGTST
eukprot:3941115-Rhodomonas_salina.1